MAVNYRTKYKRKYKAKYKAKAKRAGSRKSKKGRTMRSRIAPVAKGMQMSRTRSGPAGVGSTMQQVSDTCTRITGRAYVGEVNSREKVVTIGGNAVGLVFDINPVLLNDRVAVVASTFEKYVYHGMKFTYVPQCSTSTSGSVALVFDRDPLMYAANSSPSATQYLAEVMSYEHAVLTPAWTGTSTAYARDPQELKTWFMGGTDGTLTTRETSQGNLLVYLSNVPANVGLGFIVMDYVLDLVGPNLLPNKQDVTSVRSAPSQWLDFNGDNAGTNGTVFSPTGPNLPVGTTTRSLIQLPQPGWSTDVPELGVAGTVGEYILGGVQADNPNAYSMPTTFTDSRGVAVTFRAGQKLYFCTHAVNDATGADVLGVTFHTTLSSARAAQSEAIIAPAAFTTLAVMPDGLYTATTATQTNIGGWLRLITPGASGVLLTS